MQLTLNVLCGQKGNKTKGLLSENPVPCGRWCGGRSWLRLSLKTTQICFFARFPHLIVQPLRCIENTLHSENQRTGFVEKEARNRAGNENQKKAQTFMEKRQNYTRSSLFDKKWVKNGKHAPQTSTPIQLALLENTPFVSSRHKGSINTKDTS